MKKSVLMFNVLLLSVTAFARIGETPAQCSARYGASITNVTGSGEILGFSEYCKDGVNVVTIFNGKYKQACFVMYSRGSLRTSASRRTSIPFLKENEISSFLASLPNSWDNPKQNLAPAKKGFSHIETLAPARPVKRKDHLLPVRRPPKPSAPVLQVEQNLREACAAVEKTLPAISLELENYGYKPDHVRWVSLSVNRTGALWMGYVSLEAYKRNGSHVFAFKVIEPSSKGCVGLVFVDSEYADALASWAETHIKAAKEVKPKVDKGKVLQGF